MYNVLSHLLRICPWSEKTIDYDAETIEILRAIYKETEPNSESENEECDETDTEDSDYEPDEDLDDEESSEEEESEDEDVSRDVSEQIIIRKDQNGHYYIY